MGRTSAISYVGFKAAVKGLWCRDDAIQHPLSLRRNFCWTFVGNTVYAGCQWGVLVILAKVGSPEMVGRFALALAVTAPIFMLTNLQLSAVQVTDAKGEYSFGDYLGLRLVMTALALLLIVGVTLVVGYRWEVVLITLIIGLGKAFHALSDTFYALLQKNERMDRIAHAMMFHGLVALAALGLGVYLTGSVLWGAVGWAVGAALTLAVCNVPNGARMLRSQDASRGDAGPGRVRALELVSPRWDVRALSKLAWVALPLGFVMMLVSLNANIPRYFIERYMGERELGIFAAIAYLMVAGKMVASALAQSASPRLAKHYAAGARREYASLLAKMIGLALLGSSLGVLVVLVAGREILALLYTREYAQHSDLFLLLTIATGIGFMSSFLGHGMTAARRFAVQAPLFLTLTAILVTACAILIPRYSLRGAAFAVIITVTLQLAGSAAVVLWAMRKAGERGPS
jgi:O-antigen/teichoic acid export membrane protein